MSVSVLHFYICKGRMVHSQYVKPLWDLIVSLTKLLRFIDCFWPLRSSGTNCKHNIYIYRLSILPPQLCIMYAQYHLEHNIPISFKISYKSSYFCSLFCMCSYSEKVDQQMCVYEPAVIGHAGSKIQSSVIAVSNFTLLDKLWLPVPSNFFFFLLFYFCFKNMFS